MDHDGYGDRPWRTGRKVGRTIYDAHDNLIGVMDNRLLAALVVTGVNKLDAPVGATEVARPTCNVEGCSHSLDLDPTGRCACHSWNRTYDQLQGLACRDEEP